MNFDGHNTIFYLTDGLLQTDDDSSYDVCYNQLIGNRPQRASGIQQWLLKSASNKSLLSSFSSFF
ncbi:MAG: hypothetical protein ACD_75C01934G0002 [uncultured bacterium]|nr:MAG: hypothetical protein ACD_75C01934G0002 [uncultured bacterium]